jgi:hypothetical protein
MSYPPRKAAHFAAASKALLLKRANYCTADRALGSNLFTFENKLFMLPEEMTLDRRLAWGTDEGPSAEFRQQRDALESGGDADAFAVSFLHPYH